MGVDPDICWVCGDATNYSYSCSGEKKYNCESQICKYCNKDGELFCPDCEILEEARKQKKKPTLEEVTKLKGDQKEVIKKIELELQQYKELIKQKKEAEYAIRKYNLMMEHCKYCLKK
jgi:uncharacterized Zn finger protein (UPF0148 family)